MKKHLTLLLVIALTVGALPALTSAQEAPSLLLWVDETRSAVIEELGVSFSEEYGVELVVQQMGFGDIRDQLRIAGPAGEGPDIIIGA
ncbi:MAG: maltose ABC transporter substrate-binding protein, partial [Anaerolineae bacterium]|nr:maltose ABC transporter substrate-binding protein [Anaerolineae bacterium]